MMKLLKNRFVLMAFCMLFGLSIIANQAFAGEWNPVDAAWFRETPYFFGQNTITIYFEHDSTCTMNITLFLFDDAVKEWQINRYTRSGYLTYNASDDGVWRLRCYIVTGYGYYFTDETRDTFNIPDPEPSQNNLGTDWARHPQNWDIYKKALEIINGTTSAHEAAHKIHDHVFTYFKHVSNETYWYFRSDLELLNDLNTRGHYYGVCRSDAVILTAYARALGIPARIIHLTFNNKISADISPHYHAEFYIPNQTTPVWVPVDGDPIYSYFDFTEANEDISFNWPWSELQNPWAWEFYAMGAVKIVTRIPCGNLGDSGFTEVQYPVDPCPYTNRIPYQDP